MDTAGAYASMDGISGTTATVANFNTAPATLVSVGAYNSGSSPFTGWFSRLRVYASRLTAAQLLALSGSANSSMVATGYDSGVINAGVAVANGVGYQQSVVALSAAVTGEFARLDVSDPSNPDGYLSIPLVYAGPVFCPMTNFDFSGGQGRADGTTETVTRGGQEFPLTTFVRRTADVSFQGIRTSEAWTQIMQLDAIARKNANILWIPTPNGPYQAQEAIFGRVKANGSMTWPYQGADRRAYKFQITERL
jgi:hypothetical protein